jgi:hypothetical protein
MHYIFSLDNCKLFTYHRKNTKCSSKFCTEHHFRYYPKGPSTINFKRTKQQLYLVLNQTDMNSRYHRYTSAELTIAEKVSSCTTQTTLVDQKNSQKSFGRKARAAYPAQPPLGPVGLCGHSRCTFHLRCYSLLRRQLRGPPPLFLC